MQNVEIKVEKGIMTLTIDLKKKVGPSKSGKTEIIATSSGNQLVGDVTVGINVYRRVEK